MGSVVIRYVGEEAFPFYGRLIVPGERREVNEKLVGQIGAWWPGRFVRVDTGEVIGGMESAEAPDDEARETPGDVATEAPDDVAPEAPGDVATEAPDDVTPEAPVGEAHDTPGDVATETPAQGKLMEVENGGKPGDAEEPVAKRRSRKR